MSYGSAISSVSATAASAACDTADKVLKDKIHRLKRDFDQFSADHEKEAQSLHQRKAQCTRLWEEARRRVTELLGEAFVTDLEQMEMWRDSLLHAEAFAVQFLHHQYPVVRELAGVYHECLLVQQEEIELHKTRGERETAVNQQIHRLEEDLTHNAILPCDLYRMILELRADNVALQSKLQEQSKELGALRERVCTLEHAESNRAHRELLTAVGQFDKVDGGWHWEATSRALYLNYHELQGPEHMSAARSTTSLPLDRISTWTVTYQPCIYSTGRQLAIGVEGMSENEQSNREVWFAFMNPDDNSDNTTRFRLEVLDETHAPQPPFPRMERGDVLKFRFDPRQHRLQCEIARNDESGSSSSTTTHSIVFPDVHLTRAHLSVYILAENAESVDYLYFSEVCIVSDEP